MKVVWLGLAMVLVASKAQAMCAPPLWVGTPANTAVPPRGALYVVDEPYWSDADSKSSVGVAWEVGAGEWSKTRLSRSVWRIDYDGHDATRIIVTARGREGSYPIDWDWQPPPAAPRVTELWHQESEWTCSRTDSLNLRIDQDHAAYRVRWTYAGQTSVWIVPAHDRVLELGKIDCGGTTIPPAQLHGGGQLELTAIRADGSEVPVLGVPDPLVVTRLPLGGIHGVADHGERIVEALMPMDLEQPTDDHGPLGAVCGLLAGLLLSMGYARRAI